MKYAALLAIVALVCISAGAQAKSTCEEHRERELRGGNKFPIRLIPKCDSRGDYEPLQCHGEPTEKKRACQCWAKNGDIITAPKFSLKSCSCIMARSEAEKTRGATLPTCSADGSFERKQCVGSKCDCVNKETGKKESC